MNRIVISIVLLLLISCDPADNRLVIINETNRPVFFCVSRFDSIEGKSPLEEYMKVLKDDTLWIESDDFIKPHSKKGCPVISSWDDIIEHNFNGHLKLFVIDADTLKKYDWDKITSDSIFYRKFKLNLNDQNTLDWKITISKRAPN